MILFFDNLLFLFMPRTLWFEYFSYLAVYSPQGTQKENSPNAPPQGAEKLFVALILVKKFTADSASCLLHHAAVQYRVTNLTKYVLSIAGRNVMYVELPCTEYMLYITNIQSLSPMLSSNTASSYILLHYTQLYYTLHNYFTITTIGSVKSLRHHTNRKNKTNQLNK